MMISTVSCEKKSWFYLEVLSFENFDLAILKVQYLGKCLKVDTWNLVYT